MIKAVLFDLDGTLLDTAPDLVATVNYLRGGLGLEPMPVAELRHFVSKGAVGLIRAGLPPCDDETLLSRKDSFLAHYQQNSLVDSRPFDGVELLLSELATRGVPWGIVTNKPEYLSLPILEKIGWLSSASVVICGDTVSRGKPHPEPVLTACRVMSQPPETVLVVGDDLRDVEAGKRAGCRTAFILYGYADRESQFEIADNTALINNPSEVLDLLAAPVASP
jgi:phosphoglycolate phosphatase